MDTMDMDDLPGSVSPDMTLHVAVPEPGMYKLWFEFLGNDRLYAAPFILTAENPERAHTLSRHSLRR